MASCTADFEETNATVGDTLHALFNWSDAMPNIAGTAFMEIIDPDGETRTSYLELSASMGFKILSYVTDKSGTWTAKIKVHSGANFWTENSDTVIVATLGEVTCSAEFQGTSAEIGSPIYADFTWTNAVKMGIYGYAYLEIIDPDGIVRESWIEFTWFTGSKTLSFTTDKIGTWEAKIDVNTGYSWVTCTDTINVTEILDDIDLVKAITCDWVNDFEDYGPKVTTFELTDWIFAYLQVASNVDLYGKVMRREWWYMEAGGTGFTKRSQSDKTCTSHYYNWATWPAEDMGNQYGPGEGYVIVRIDGDYLGKTNNYQVLGDSPNMKIEPSSEFFTGPFAAGTIQTVASVDVTNDGDVAATLQIELWEYPGTTNENRVAYWSIPNLAPGETIIKGLDVAIPPGTTWPLGIKVWGVGETEPSF